MKIVFDQWNGSYDGWRLAQPYITICK